MKVIKNKQKLKRNVQLYVIDTAIVALIHYAVWMMEVFLNSDTPSAIGAAARTLLPELLTVTGIYLLLSILARVNQTIWRYAVGNDYLYIFAISLLSGIAFCCVQTLAFHTTVSFPCSALAAVLCSAALTSSRILYHELMLRRHGQGTGPRRDTPRRLLLVGAGSACARLLDEIRYCPGYGLNPVCLADDDPQKQHRRMCGVTVAGTIRDIPDICRKYDIELIYITIPSATNEQRAAILDECLKSGCPVKILPHLIELNGSGDYIGKLRSITPEELLGREPVRIADENILRFISGKTVLITGGGGSIGSELCRQIAAHSPRRLIIVDIYENNAYAIQQELKNKYGSGLNLEVYIATVCDYPKINSILAAEKPDIVLHAAAHKHVPLMETVPDECVKNNVFGTYNTVMAARANRVSRFILISTDKAVNPTNIMGATKRLCEMIIQYADAISPDTTYAAVRFGNVLGSNGSVIPLFRKQIEQRIDVTVTHPDIIRYFMTIPEASQLVLTAGAMAHGGEIFVLDMGKPVRIADLAKKMIQLSGLTLGRDINIRYIGLRPGEKLYEELLMSEEGLRKTLNEKIFIGSAIQMDYNAFTESLASLKTVAEREGVTPSDVEAKLMELVPTFHRFDGGALPSPETEEQDESAGNPAYDAAYLAGLEKRM